MKGFYVYCIRAHDAKVKSFKAKRGITFGGSVYAVPLKDIEAVVSEVDTVRFGDKVLKEKLQDDAQWAAKNVKNHHAVVTEASGLGTAIPMKFGTIFTSRRNLDAMLKKNLRKFRDLLSWLKGKQEWGVKIYLDHKKFGEALKKKDKGLRTLEKKHAAASEGVKWYIARKIDERMNARLEEEAGKYLEQALRKLEYYAEKTALGSLLAKDLVGKQDETVPTSLRVRDRVWMEMVLNGSFLIPDKELEHFKSACQKICNDFAPAGFEFELTGPWPPYNFVKNDEKG